MSICPKSSIREAEELLGRGRPRFPKRKERNNQLDYSSIDRENEVLDLPLPTHRNNSDSKDVAAAKHKPWQRSLGRRVSPNI